MTKKSVSKLLQEAEKSSGTHLSRRIAPTFMKRIEADMDDIAVAVRDGAIRPSFPVLVDFLKEEHNVTVAVGTAKALYFKAQKRIKNGKV